MHIKLPQKMEDALNFWRRKLLPRTLFFRTMMLIFVPLIVVQIVSVVVFFDGSWSRMGRRLSDNLAEDIEVIISLKTSGMPVDEIRKNVTHNLGINFNFYENKSVNFLFSSIIKFSSNVKRFAMYAFEIILLSAALDPTSTTNFFALVTAV